MKIFGSWTRLVAAVFRKDSQDITLRENQSTTYTSDRDIQLPPGDTDHIVVSASSTQTLTNKTIDGDDNTVQDLSVSSIKTEAGSPNVFISRDGSGAPIETKAVPTGDVLGTTDTQTVSGKSIDADSNTITNIENADIKAAAAIDATKISSGSVDNTEFNKLSTVGSNASGEIVDTTSAQDVSNKTFDDSTTSFEDTDDTTKSARFSISASQAGSSVTNHTLPPSGGALVNVADTQSLSNKTLDDFKYSSTSVALAANAIAHGVTSILRITSGTGPLSSITAGAVEGDVRVIVNELGSSLTITNDSGAEGFLTGTGADLTIGDDGSMQVVYDSGTSRWNVVSTVPAGAGGDVTASANMTDNSLVRGDGGAKGVQDSGISIADDDEISGATIFGMEEQGSTPSTPAASNAKLYFKNDSELYRLDDAGNETFATPPVKYQYKTLSANTVGATGVVTDLTFNNLEIGKTYRWVGSLRAANDGTGDKSSIQFRVSLEHNSVILDQAETQMQGDDAVNFTVNRMKDDMNMDIIFVAAATTITVNILLSTGSELEGDGTRAQTWARIEELPRHEVTTDWT